MNSTEAYSTRARSAHLLSAFPVLTVPLSLAAITATYLLASSTLEIGIKTRAFSAIIAAFLIGCGFLHFRQGRPRAVSAGRELDHHLSVLDEAKEYFAGALNSADTFRLVVSRIRAIVPLSAACLWLLDSSRTSLTISEAVGLESDERKCEPGSFGQGLAGESYNLGEVTVGTEAFHSDHPVESVAIPLFREQQVFAVLQLFVDEKFEIESTERSTLESIGTRVAPLILSSMAFERSQANALTDATTELPNERAFRLLLENQIAEAIRKRSDRPLTILTIDVKGFDEINRGFGHAAGDMILNHVAQTIKENLRQMDFFARALDDEFLAILPTASKEMSSEVIARINTGFFERKVKLGNTGSVEVELNFGWAAFGDDGETPDQLLSTARLRKEQAKYSSPRKVLTFSKQLVN